MSHPLQRPLLLGLALAAAPPHNARAETELVSVYAMFIDQHLNAWADDPAGPRLPAAPPPAPPRTAACSPPGEEIRYRGSCEAGVLTGVVERWYEHSSDGGMVYEVLRYKKGKPSGVALALRRSPGRFGASPVNSAELKRYKSSRQGVSESLLSSWMIPKAWRVAAPDEGSTPISDAGQRAWDEAYDWGYTSATTPKTVYVAGQGPTDNPTFPDWTPPPIPKDPSPCRFSGDEVEIANYRGPCLNGRAEGLGEYWIAPTPPSLIGEAPPRPTRQYGVGIFHQGVLGRTGDDDAALAQRTVLWAQSSTWTLLRTTTERGYPGYWVRRTPAELAESLAAELERPHPYGRSALTSYTDWMASREPPPLAAPPIAQGAQCGFESPDPIHHQWVRRDLGFRGRCIEGLAEGEVEVWGYMEAYSYLVGDFHQGRPSGRWIAVTPTATWVGRSEAEGSFTGVRWTSAGAREEGNIVSGRLDGPGERVEADGTIRRGQFIRGWFVEGTVTQPGGATVSFRETEDNFRRARGESVASDFAPVVEKAPAICEPGARVWGRWRGELYPASVVRRDDEAFQCVVRWDGVFYTTTLHLQSVYATNSAEGLAAQALLDQQKAESDELIRWLNSPSYNPFTSSQETDRANAAVESMNKNRDRTMDDLACVERGEFCY